MSVEFSSNHQVIFSRPKVVIVYATFDQLGLIDHGPIHQSQRGGPCISLSLEVGWVGWPGKLAYWRNPDSPRNNIWQSLGVDFIKRLVNCYGGFPKPKKVIRTFGRKIPLLNNSAPLFFWGICRWKKVAEICLPRMGKNDTDGKFASANLARVHHRKDVKKSE